MFKKSTEKEKEEEKGVASLAAAKGISIRKRATKTTLMNLRGG